MLTSLVGEEDVGHHHVRSAVGRAGRRLLQEGAREHVRVAGRELNLRRQRPRDLHVDLLTDVRVGGAAGDAREQRAAGRVEAVGLSASHHE